MGLDLDGDVTEDTTSSWHVVHGGPLAGSVAVAGGVESVGTNISLGIPGLPSTGTVSYLLLSIMSALPFHLGRRDSRGLACNISELIRAQSRMRVRMLRWAKLDLYFESVERM